MFKLSRRAFIQALAATPVMFWAPASAQTSPLIRHDANSPEGMAMLAILAQAVDAMKARPPADPLSWTWQWYTHFVDGATTKGDEINRIFGSGPTVAGTLAEETWNTCQSHAGQDPNHFLPWHRMYVYFFEQIVRRVSGRADFTLPYWNYTSPDPAHRGVVPEAFRLPDDPVFAPLYRPNRTALANSGQPIHSQLAFDAMDVDAQMAAARYSDLGSVQGFCRAIDSSIHGRIHVLVGNRWNMGRVPYAAQDPLFWVHHANIDRLWASWNADGGVNPSAQEWSYRTFVFANQWGSRVEQRLRAYFKTSTLGYAYDELHPPMRATGTTSAMAAATQAGPAAGTQAVRLARAPSAELGEGMATVRLQPVSNAAATAMQAAAPAAGKRTYLVLKDLHAWAQPEVLYYVYLTSDRGAAGRNGDTFAGDINFFDAEFHDHGDGGALGDALGANFYSFDVTAILERLNARPGNPRNELWVSIVPSGRPTRGARPLVSTIELVQQ